MAVAKGLWIPLDILQRRDLRIYDKVVLALVSYLDQYGGLCRDHYEQWAQTLGCDTQWLDSELRRLASLGLVHRRELSWRLGPSNDDPRSQLPELPPDAEVLSVSRGVAAVWDATTNSVKMYRAPDSQGA